MDTLRTAKRIVIKIGSALLVDAAYGALRADWLKAFAEDIKALRAAGQDVVIVSSGSIALGREILELPKGELPLDQSQAAAAVGQIRLAHAYDQVLSPLTTAQLLLTLEDSRARRRYLNFRSTLEALIGQGAVPIVNENDTIATDEIRYGDNDRLAAQVAVMCGADVLVLLSDVDGLYTANPQIDAAAVHLPVVDEITSDIEAMAGSAGSAAAKGGMRTKIMAAQIAVAGGVEMMIADGRLARPLQAVLNGARTTRFLAGQTPAAARKNWISAMRSEGSVTLDAGAVTALQRGKSLLPVGVTAVEGSFERGDPVAILTPEGQEVAKGLVDYSAKDINRIKGAQGKEIAEILGHAGRHAVVHRDNMVMK